MWNLKRLTDPAVGSSFIGLIQDFLLKSVPDGTDKNGKPKTKLVWWDANAIEKVDSTTPSASTAACRRWRSPNICSTTRP